MTQSDESVAPICGICGGPATRTEITAGGEALTPVVLCDAEVCKPRSDGSIAVPAGAIGSEVWPGTAKLAEECGELLQVLGKLQAYPGGDHPDGAGSLAWRLMQEMADVMAAAEFVAEANHTSLSANDLRYRAKAKLDLFRRWHRGAGS